MRVQIGSVSLPIFLTPRIKGLAIKVSDIKNIYSNQYISDALTPLNFVCELEVRGGAPIQVSYSPALSTDSLIYFPIPDSIYASELTYTIIFYWTVSNLVPTVIEKIFGEQRLELQVQDLHNNPG